MARIRSVHPGLWTDDAFMGFSPHARLLFIGLLNECDDRGVFPWKPRTLKARLLPADNIDMDALLDELRTAMVKCFLAEDGNLYGAVRNFCRWQRPKKPNYTYPITDELRTYVDPTRRSSEPNGDLDEPIPPPVPHQGSTSVPPHFPTNGVGGQQREEGGGRKKEGKKDSLPRKRGTRLPDDWVPAQPARDLARTLGLDPGAVLEKFRDYWLAKPGQGGVKLDWDATYRNWCRNEADRHPQRPGRRPDNQYEMTGDI